MKSRDFVRETFNWQYYYYYLLPEGIEYLREYLRLPEDIVPEVGRWLVGLDELEVDLSVTLPFICIYIYYITLYTTFQNTIYLLLYLMFANNNYCRP